MENQMPREVSRRVRFTVLSSGFQDVAVGFQGGVAEGAFYMRLSSLVQ